MAQLPKGGLVRGHDKPIHGSCAIYFPGGILKMIVIFFWGGGASKDGHVFKTPFTGVGFSRTGSIGGNGSLY